MTAYLFPDVAAMDAWQALIRREIAETDAATAKLAAETARLKAKARPATPEPPSPERASACRGAA